MVSKTYQRYIWLLNLLYPSQKLTLTEICKLWQHCPLSDGKSLPERTFHVHRKAVEEMFGVEIACETTGKHRYFVKNPEVLENDFEREWLLKGYNIPEQFSTFRMMADCVLLEKMGRGAQYVDYLLTAIRFRRVIKLEYQPYLRAGVQFKFFPYALKAYRRQWYAIGRKSDCEKIFCICLDRIKSGGFSLTEEKFERPEDFNAQEYFANVVGVFHTENFLRQSVRIKVYGEKIEALRSLPLHPSQREIQGKHGEYQIFEYQLALTPELETEILSMGEKAEVLAPQELKEKIKERLSLTLKRY